MHEISLARGLCRQLDRLRRERAAVRVREATVEVGALSNVVPESLGRAFEVCREEWPALAEATLVVRHVPLTLECRTCGRVSETGTLRLRCPGCGSARVEVRAGEALLLREVALEVEEDDDERAAPVRDGKPAQVQ